VHRFLGKWPVATLLAALTTCGNAGAAELSGRGTSTGESMTESMCLTWESRPNTDCPRVEEIAVAVRDTLGRPLASHGTCETRVTASFRSDSMGGWSVDVHFASQTGEALGDRYLEIRDAPCSALKEPLALVIALMVEGKSSESAPLRLPRPASLRSDAASTNMTAISMGGAFSSGLTADVGLGATVGVASRVVAGLPLRLETSFWFPTGKETPGPALMHAPHEGSTSVAPARSKRSM